MLSWVVRYHLTNLNTLFRLNVCGALVSASMDSILDRKHLIIYNKKDIVIKMCSSALVFILLRLCCISPNSHETRIF